MLIKQVQKFLIAVANKMKAQAATWFVGLIIALLGIFSSHITESVKFSLNKADLRSQKYETLATEVSNYIFASDTLIEFVEHDWMTRKNAKEIEADYDKSITILKQKEFIYLAWIQKYWGNEYVELFESFMNSIDEFGYSARELNTEFDRLELDSTIKKMDVSYMKNKIKVMHAIHKKMRLQGKTLLIALSK